jgi:lipoprotein NlpI
LGQFNAAEDDIAHSLSLAPTDTYSVLWLYLARARGGKDAKAALRENSAALKSTTWPEPVIRMYLGSLKPADVLASAKDSNATKNSEQHCEAYFFLGEDALLRGHLVKARKLFQQSISTGAAEAYYAYRGAEAEIDRMNTKTQARQATTH